LCFFFNWSFCGGVEAASGLVPLLVALDSSGDDFVAARWCGVDAALGSVDWLPGVAGGVASWANRAVLASIPAVKKIAL